jgi:hypothetical protein
MGAVVPALRLANPEFAGQKLRGVYYFPGDGVAAPCDASLAAVRNYATQYSVFPTDFRELRTDTDPAAGAFSFASVAGTGANVVALSFWGRADMGAADASRFSPMRVTSSPVFDPSIDSFSHAAVQARNAGMLYFPAIESGTDSSVERCSYSQGYEFGCDLRTGARELLRRVDSLVLYAMIGGYVDRWATVSRNGETPRHVIQLVHANPAEPWTDTAYTRILDAVAADIDSRYAGFPIGFVLDLPANDPNAPSPQAAGTSFARSSSILGIMPYASEVFGPALAQRSAPRKVVCDRTGCYLPGCLRSSTKCALSTTDCRKDPDVAPVDNTSKFAEASDEKRDRMAAWRATGLPVILDATNGMDGRFVWAPQGSQYYGDNFGGIDDRWRNEMSVLNTFASDGVILQTWNGFTEGWAMAPSYEYGTTAYLWGKGLLSQDAGTCTHRHFQGGLGASTVAGSFCSKWIERGAYRGALGAPIGGQVGSRIGTKQAFQYGAIFQRSGKPAFEVHGAIYTRYLQGTTAAALGYPIADEIGVPGGRRSDFEGGSITWLAATGQTVVTRR